MDPSGRYLMIKAEIKDIMYILINIYAPNKDTNIVNFFNNLLMTLRKNDFDEEENIIIGGDFNCPLNPLLDKKGGILIPRKSVVTTIDSLQEELDLVDIWRIKNPAKRSFTWSQNHVSNDFSSIRLLADFKYPTRLSCNNRHNSGH